MFKRIRLIMALVFLGLCSGSLMAQTVSGSYMISSTNEFGTHYLAFDGTSLADATTFNPATCMWDVAITDGTCTVSMDGNYLTMSGSTVAIGTPATTFTISDGKLMAGGNYLVFDDEWKAVDNSGYKCYLSSPAEGIPYMISYDGNYLGYHVKADGKSVEIINETFYNPATCIWYLTSDNKLRTNVLTVNNQQKIYYLKFQKNGNAGLDTENNSSVVSQDESKHSFYIPNDNANKLVYLIYNNGVWKGSNETNASPINAGIYSQLEIYSITDGAKYLGVNGSSIEYSTTASQWFAETSGEGKTLHQGSNYLTLGTTLGNLPGIAATGTAFDLTDNYIKSGDNYLGYIGWTGSASSTGAATLTGPSKAFVFTFETTNNNVHTEHFMVINNSGSITNLNLFDPNTCVWLAIPSGTGGYYMSMASGGNMYYLMGNGATLSTTTSIASATAFNISGHIVNYRSTNNKTYSITCNNGTWGLSEKAAQAVYFELESHYTDPGEATDTPSVSITVLDSISGNYFETSAHTLADLGRYYFHADVDGMAYPGYMTYNILNSPYSIRTYYMLDGGTACITELPMPGTNPNTTWSLQNLNSGTALSHLHHPTSGFNNDLLLKYGTYGSKDIKGWGVGNTDYVRGEPQQVKLTYTFNSDEASSGLTAEVILTVKAPTWKDYVIAAPEGFPYYDPNDATKLLIRDEKDLAWVISYVNAFNRSSHHDLSGKTICLTKDLDLGEYQWCPISTHQSGTADLAGNFDGRGYIIKDLRCSLYAIPGSEETITKHLPATRGFIGNYGEKSSGIMFENTFFENVEVGWPGGTDDYSGHLGHHLIVGGIIAGSDGSFTVKNCGISGRVFIGTEETPNSKAVVGAICGYVNGGTIESCYSVAEVDGINAGGLVGCLASGSVKNCLVNPIIKILGASSKGGEPSFNGYAGAIIGQNGAAIENCYVRLREGCAVDEDYFGLIAGQNTSTINYCYVHKDHTNVEGGSGTHSLVADGTQPASYGLYNNTIPYKYEGLNNTLTTVYGSTTYAEVDMSLLDALNNYAGTSANGISTRWARTTSDINEDYPILRFDDFNNICSYRVAVNHDGPDGPTDELLDPFMYYKPTLPEGFAKAATYENGAVVALYKNEDIRETAVEYDEAKIKFYIDEEASLLHDDNSPLEAYVGVTFRNALPGKLNHDTPANCYWHMLSSPLVANSTPLGINYNGDNTQYNAYPVEDDNLPEYGWLTEGDLTNNGYFADDTPYGAYDFYSWYEPEYQWVNFKRNGPSHWHEDVDTGGNHNHFDYKPEVGGTTNVNESYLIPGKGYLMAIDKQMFLQTHGTLNEGDVTYPITCSAAHIPGYNFIGNPYHSYLDIEAFFDENESQIWSSSASYPRNYILMNGNEYITYVEGISDYAAGAPRYLNMHQGFIVIADKNGTVTFTNAMRTNDGEPNFREAKINYPLINLHVTDENGYGEVAVVEVGRPERGGARKAHEISRANCILYAHQGDEDYSVLFLEEGISSTGVWFEPFSDGQFTMKWDTHNGTFDYLHLIDNIAGVDIDCTTTDSYTFQSSTSDYKSRFKLVFSYTGVEENEEDASTGSASFAFQSGDNLIVNGEGRLEIIDMNGRLISATELYGAQNAIAMPNVAQGVYMLRQISNNNVKVQKIVVK